MNDQQAKQIAKQLEQIAASLARMESQLRDLVRAQQTQSPIPPSPRG